jgi:hypothetical protein
MTRSLAQRELAKAEELAADGENVSARTVKRKRLRRRASTPSPRAIRRPAIPAPATPLLMAAVTRLGDALGAASRRPGVPS